MSAATAEQLCLDVSVEKMKSLAAPEIDLVDSVLAACDGDARLAIRELLADADHLRDQLHIASTIMSKGMGRGWRPQYERVQLFAIFTASAIIARPQSVARIISSSGIKFNPN